MVPRLPIPNRTVKRTSADDSVDTHVKVGHCQTPIEKPPLETAGASLCAGEKEKRAAKKGEKGKRQKQEKGAEGKRGGEKEKRKGKKKKEKKRETERGEAERREQVLLGGDNGNVSYLRCRKNLWKKAESRL